MLKNKEITHRKLSTSIRISKEFAFIISAFIVLATLSIYLHMPRETVFFNNPGLIYSDIIYGVYNPIFLDIVSPSGLVNEVKISERWFNRDVALRFIQSRLCPAPYVDYKFEYPPIVATLWYLSTCISFMATFPTSYTSSEYYILVKKAGEIHYYIQSLFISISLIVSSIYMYRLARITNTSWKRVMLFALLPSTILYTIYNWDMITAMFVLMSLYYLQNRKYFISGLLLGLGISTKLLPLLFAVIVVYDLIQKSFNNKEFMSILKTFSLGLIITGLTPYTMISLLSYNGFTHFIQHHAQWYCENCVYLLITRDVWNPYNRSLAILIIFLALIIMISLDINYNDTIQLTSISLISLIIATALNYVFSPQMMLMITSIAILILSLRQLIFLVIADIANFGIMALFFKDAEARLWLAQNLGLRISTSFSPWTLDSPVQILAIVRNIILILIMIDLIYSMLKIRSGISIRI